MPACQTSALNCLIQTLQTILSKRLIVNCQTFPHSELNYISFQIHHQVMEECSYNNCLISFSYMQSSQTEVHAIYCITFINCIWLQVKSLLLFKCETISSCCLSFAYFSKAFCQSCLPNLLLFLTLFPILP